MGLRIIRFAAFGVAGIWLAVSVPALAEASDPSQRTATSSESRQITFSQLRTLEFDAPDNLRGALSVRAEVGRRVVQLDMEKLVNNLPEGEQATRILQSVTVAANVSEDRLIIEAQTPPRAEWEGTQIGVTCNLNILIPAGVDIDARSSMFDFDLTGPFPKVVVNGVYGKVRLEGVTESADVRTEYGDVLLAKTNERIVVNNRFGKTTIKNSTVGGERLRVRTERGTVDIQALTGPVDIAADKATVTLGAWTVLDGLSRITTNNAPISIGLSAWGTPRLVIENKNADVEVATPADFSALLRLNVSESGRGYIRTRGVPVKATRLDNQTLEGVAGSGDGRLEIAINGFGEITLNGPHPRPVVKKDESP